MSDVDRFPLSSASTADPLHLHENRTTSVPPGYVGTEPQEPEGTTTMASPHKRQLLEAMHELGAI